MKHGVELKSQLICNNQLTVCSFPFEKLFNLQNIQAMKLNYKFSNLVGTVYRKGNVLFTPDGDTVISPVGNKVTFYNLKEHKSSTLSVESSFDIICIALGTGGNSLLIFDESGEGYYVNLASSTVIHRHSFFKIVKICKFSPDSQFFVVCRDSDALLFKAPGPQTGHYNPFFLDRTYALAHDSIITLDWSHDSKFFVCGSLDSGVRVCATKRYKNIYVYNLSGHSSAIVGCFFEDKTYD
uniref:Uncharacterized protein n=1 Tax=Romanomermis culicivorax TaxID=13658 RepID=A0A915KP00_ROMCU